MPPGDHSDLAGAQAGGCRPQAGATVRGCSDSRTLGVDLVEEEASRLLLGSSLLLRVHSVFARALNLCTSDGRWLSLLAGGHRGPDRAHLRCLPVDFLRMGVLPDQSVRPLGGWLSLMTRRGRVRMELRGARSYRLPRAEPLLKAGPILESGLEVIRGILDLDRVARPPNDWEEAATRKARCLVGALRNGDPVEVQARAAGTIGLGQGLTPTGDDLLLGLLATLQHIDPAPAAIEPPGSLFSSTWLDLLNRSLRTCLSGREQTTDPGRQQLLQGLAGRHIEPLPGVLRRVHDGSEAPLREACQELISIGASSGRSLLGGVELGLELIQESRA